MSNTSVYLDRKDLHTIGLSVLNRSEDAHLKWQIVAKNMRLGWLVEIILRGLSLVSLFFEHFCSCPRPCRSAKQLVASQGENLLDRVVVPNTADDEVLGAAFYKGANEVDDLVGGSTLACLEAAHRGCRGAVVAL